MKKAIYFCILAAVLVISFACDIGFLQINGMDNVSIEEPIFSGLLKINFGQSGSKSILPSADDLTITHYDVNASGPDNHTFEVLNTTQTSIEKSGINFGLWTITVYGKNAQGIVIAAGSEDIVMENSNATININLLPLAGEGSLTIDVSWPVDVIDNPTITATLKKLGETAQAIPFPVIATNQVPYEYSVIDSGSYTLVIALSNNGITVATIIESIIVLQDITTNATIALSSNEINQPPAAPADLSATEGLNSIIVSWSDNSDVELSYCIERSTLDEGNYIVLDDTLSANTTQFIDTTIDPDTTYFYRVRASNAFGDSTYSNSDQSILNYPESNLVISGNPYTINPHPEFSWAPVNGATRYRYQLNSELGQWSETSETSCSSNVFSNGVYTLYIQAGDDAGHWSASSTFDFEYYWNQLSVLNDNIIRPKGPYHTTNINESLLFTVNPSNGIEIFDLSIDAENPEFLSSLQIDYAVDIAVQGNYVYVVAEYMGLTVVDVTDPRAPFIVSELSSGQNYSIIVNGPYAYIAGAYRGLIVVDISDPANPFVETEITLNGGSAVDVAVQGNYAYVAEGSSGLSIVKIDDIANASLVNTIQTGNARGLYADANNYIYIADRECLQIINVEYPETATAADIIGSYYGVLDWPEKITVRNDYAYISQMSNRDLVIVNVADRTSPQYVGSLPMLSAGKIGIYGNYAYLGNDTSGYAVIDITDPENAVPTTVYDAFQPKDVCVSGNYAFIAGGVAGLIIVDISVPNNPVVETTIEIENAVAVDIKDNYVFVANYTDGVAVVSIESTITDSAIVAEINNVLAEDILICGDYAFTYRGTSEVYVIDISDPVNINNTSLVSTIPYSGQAIQMATDGNYLYMASSYDGLDIIDITDIGTASVIKNIDTNRAYGVAVNGDYVYLSDNSGIIYVFDVTDPVNAFEITTIDASIFGYGNITIANNNLFMTSFFNSTGVYILDIYDPLSPVVVKSIPCTDAKKTLIYDDNIYAMSDQLGLVIIGE